MEKFNVTHTVGRDSSFESSFELFGDFSGTTKLWGVTQHSSTSQTLKERISGSTTWTFTIGMLELLAKMQFSVENVFTLASLPKSMTFLENVESPSTMQGVEAGAL
jgi:hypothetical protein